MADFQEVMRHKVRMCRQAVTCEKCPMFKGFWERDSCLLPREQCHAFVGRHPDEAEPIIMGWAAKHPEKTMKDVLLEKFPKAMLRVDGMPCACVTYLGLGKCIDNCAKHWCSPAPEE